MKELIEKSEGLCYLLVNECIKDDIYPVSVCVELENYKWEMVRLTDKIKYLNEMYG